MNFIGIDLAWTRKNATGIVVLNENKEIVFQEARVFSDEEIIAIMKRFLPCITSIDAPLVVKNESGSRLCDRHLMKEKIHNRYLKLFATSRTYMLKTFKGIRGETLMASLDERFVIHENVLETYPTGIFLSLFPEIYDFRYKLSSKNDLKTLIENAKNLLNKISELGFVNLQLPFNAIKTKVVYKKYEDIIDGYLCSLTSYYYFINQVTRYQVDDNGCLVLPKYKPLAT